ncbi:hypothetical protein D9M73_144650 [compost metagenome]
MGQVLTRGNGCGKGGDDSIAGTGHIEHLACPCRQVQRRLTNAQQGHAMLAAGDQQGAQVQVLQQLQALGDQFGLIDATANDGLELAEVRGNQAGATVDGKVLALGVGQHRNALGPRRLDQVLVVLQCTFAVVGQDQHLDAFEQAVDLRAQRQWVGGERLFEIDTQQLLVTAHDPQLDDSRLVRDALEYRTDTGSLQAVGQAVSSLILAGDADQRSRRAQRSNVQGNVGRAAGAILDLIDLDHRDWRFRRNTRSTAMPVAVEHDIADHQYRGLIETRHGQLHGQPIYTKLTGAGY